MTDSSNQADNTHMIQVDPSYADDADSSLGSDASSSTTSITESILEYRKIHGRTFQNFNTGTEYWGPNDETQNETLDITHHMLYLARDNRLFISPIGPNPQRVIDIGTGTGIWCIDFADQFPSASVIGTDLSPTQQCWVPPNCKFELDDAQLEWTYPDNHFDLVHIRCLMGSIKDWPALYAQAMRTLKPGGWLEHYDFSLQTTCDDGSMPPDCPWYDWTTLFQDAGEKMGRTFKVIDGHRSRKWIEDAGFVNLREEWHKLPVGGWAKDKKWKEVGEYNALATDTGLEGYCLYMLTNVYGWEYSKVQAFVDRARKALRDRNIHAYFPGAVVCGQKPFEKGKEPGKETEGA